MNGSSETDSRVVLEVDLARLRENFLRISAAVAPLRVIAVLKADAYGLGMRPVAAALVDAGIAAIAVAELREAQAAAGLGVPVLLLGAALPDELEPALAAGIRLPVADLDSARRISDAAGRLRRTALGHLAVDSGMGRLGIPHEEAAGTIRAIARLPNLHLEGLYSHFPMAVPAARDFTRTQLARIAALLQELAAAGLVFAWRHVANSDAVNYYPEACRAPFTHVRVGLGLHGSFDPEGCRAWGLRSVVTLRARLAQVRTLPAGRTIGYNATYTCARPTRVGTVAAGYADGLPFALSNRGRVLIRGRACPVLGRVSMDYTNVSLEAVPDAAPGDTVFCLGGPDPEAVTVEEWARLKGTHPYEILCAIGPRVDRRPVRRPV